jgi:NADP-dependent 3-hydroxy acid dehydrogenase YdfG
MFEVNSLGVISMTREVLPHMKKSGQGQILNIISTAGVEVYEHAPVYTATKHAVRGFTESLKKELAGSGVRVMGLYPGGIDADLFTTQPFPAPGSERSVKEIAADIVYFMLSQPDEISIEQLRFKRIVRQ